MITLLTGIVLNFPGILQMEKLKSHDDVEYYETYVVHFNDIVIGVGKLFSVV